MDVARLLQLTEMIGVSGSEKEISEFLKTELSSLGFSCQIDAFGNVIGRRAGKGKNILLEAHIDQVGMMVSGLTDDGFVRFSPVGGLDLRVLPSQEVLIHGKETVAGVICLHPSEDSDKNSKVLDFKRLSIDCGLENNSSDLIAVGDPVSFAVKSFEQNGCVFGSGLDNRVSVETVLSLISVLDPSVSLTVLFAVQEEVGHFGASVASCFEDVDLAIVLDVTLGAVHDDVLGTFACGDGPAIGIGPSVSNKEAVVLRQIAEKSKIPYQIEVMGGSSGTDAWVIQLMEDGIPTVMLSVPLRYMHTPIECVTISDVENAVSLLNAYIREVCFGD